MDPQVGVDSPSATLNFHIYNGLIKIDDNREPVGDLAESFEIVDDTKYKFKLRKGVKFHNGDELKASDVKFSLERANTIAPANANAVSFPYILFLMHMSSLLLYCYIIFSFSLYFPHPEIHFRQFSATTFICPVSRFL